MDNTPKKACYYMAKFQALSNAAEFIRSHGEEGFSFEDKGFNDEYRHECKKLSKQLEHRAEGFYKKYLNTGISINTTIDQNY